jgi:peptidoglycan/LPS O-acetylase OafA/YrhL
MRKHEYRLGYRPDLEGLRAIAILAVVGAHAGIPGLQGGFVGVDVFFVLSGFLITGLLSEEVRVSGRIDFAAFYVRRVRRLLPALLLMLVGSSILASVLLAPAEQPAQAIAAASAALWLSNIHFALAKLDYFSPASESNLFLHTWSLGVEEQFYLVWPALLALLALGTNRSVMRRWITGLLVVLAVSSLGCQIATYRAPAIAFYMMPVRAWQFALGGLAWALVGGGSSGRVGDWVAKVPQLLGWLGLSAIILSACLFDRGMPYPGGYAWLPSIGAFLIAVVGAVAGGTIGVGSILSSSPMQAIGRISYSWYLWHWPILLLGRALGVGDNLPLRLTWVFVSLVIAILSRTLVENPLRNASVWLRRPRMVLFVSVALMVVTGSGALRWNAQGRERAAQPEFAKYSEAHRDAPRIYAMGCDDWYRSDRVKVCEFGRESSRHTAVLMGDSHAGQWFSTVAGAILPLKNWRLLVITKSSCPMVEEPLFYERIGREYTECETWRKAAIARVASIKPDVVFLGTTTGNPFGERQWVEGTQKVLDELSPSVGHVMILRDTPSIPFDGPDCLARLAVRPKGLSPHSGCSAPVKDVRAAAVYQWLKVATRSFGNVELLDLNDLVCPSQMCAAEQRGEIVFRDSQHLTDSFAASLAPALRARLSRVLALNPTASPSTSARSQ